MSKKKNYIYHQVICLKEMINEHFKEEISVEHLLKQLGSSNYHFIRLFKALYGLPPHQYLAQLRIKGAKYELTHTDLSIDVIYRKYGFADEQSFVSTFVRFTGQDPDQYRKLHQIMTRNRRNFDRQVAEIFDFANQKMTGLLAFQGFTAVSYHRL